MGESALTLDNILAASQFFVGKWTPALKRNQSRDLLRHLLCRLHGASKGNLFDAKLRASHADLGQELGLSREWVCKLGQRLQASGWIQYHASRLPDGTYEIGVFSAGRTLKRLLCMLLGSRKPKNRVNDVSPSFPLLQKERKKIFPLARKQPLEREKEPLPEQVLEKMPLLRQWMKRGPTEEPRQT